MTRNEIISTIRGYLKENTADSVYSSRTIWNLFNSSYKTLIKRDADNRQLYNQSSWQTYCLPLEQVSPILCDCISLPVDCEFMISRTKCKIPPLLDSSIGPIFRFISTLDNSKQFVLTNPQSYANKSKVKFNKQLYAFYHNNYMWFPSVKYPFILISGIFDDSSPVYAEFLSCVGQNTSSESCPGNKLNQAVTGPDYLVYPAIQMVLQIIMPTKNIQPDAHPNTNPSQTTISQP